MLVRGLHFLMVSIKNLNASFHAACLYRSDQCALFILTSFFFSPSFQRTEMEEDLKAMQIEIQ